MPYITREQRERLDILARQIKDAGELNYCLTRTILEYLGENPRYQNYNDVIGVLECMKQEIYRRKIASYEDKKIIENGDVF
jgi:hypothetical protein